MDRFGKDHDRELVELLGKLKDTGAQYPPRLYWARRAAVIGAFAALPIGGALAISLFARLAKIVKSMSVVDKVILAVEVTAITGVSAYGAAAAYIYRNELKALLLGQPTAITSPIPSLSAPIEPVLPATEATPSETPLPTGTVFAIYTSTAGANQPPVIKQPAATQPPPPAKATSTKGLRLGNTKTPKPTSGP